MWAKGSQREVSHCEVLILDIQPAWLSMVAPVGSNTCHKFAKDMREHPGQHLRASHTCAFD